MDLALPEYRKKLISKITAASSTYQVRRYIETAIKALVIQRVNGYIVERFMEKLTLELKQKLSEAAIKCSSDNICYAIQLLEPVKRD